MDIRCEGIPVNNFFRFFHNALKTKKGKGSWVPFPFRTALLRKISRAGEW